MAIRFGTVIRESDRLLDLLLSLFNVDVDDNGKVTVTGDILKQYVNKSYVSNITYSRKEYTKEEAIKDFCLTRLLKIVERWDVFIYKVEKL